MSINIPIKNQKTSLTIIYRKYYKYSIWWMVQTCKSACLLDEKLETSQKLGFQLSILLFLVYLIFAKTLTHDA